MFFFCIFWLIFYPLDPDPGSQNLADPTDPKHCFKDFFKSLKYLPPDYLGMDEEVGGEAEVDVAEVEVGLMIEVGEGDSRTDEEVVAEEVITTKEVNMFFLVTAMDPNPGSALNENGSGFRPFLQDLLTF